MKISIETKHDLIEDKVDMIVHINDIDSKKMYAIIAYFNSSHTFSVKETVSKKAGEIISKVHGDNYPMRNYIAHIKAHRIIFNSDLKEAKLWVDENFPELK